jgi:two-component system response regulator (stage 0 sporulation protein A)
MEPINETQPVEATNPDYPLYKEITRALKNIGIPGHLLGWGYVREAVLLAMKNRNILTAITNELYPQIARKFDTTPRRVERAIRHAVEAAWDRGDLDVLGGLFGNSISRSKGKPTNKEFIATVVDYLCLEMGLC